MVAASIYGLTYDQMASWLLGYGHKKSRASQIWDWLYKKRAARFADMLDVHPDCLQLAADHYGIHTLTEHAKQESADKTVKYLFKLQDGNLIETVLMRHKFGLSVCVTTQVGCNIGCSFCASGLLPKSRDLTCAEIVEQIMQVQRDLDQAGRGEEVSHVVVMGIGEPFDNYSNLINFLQVINNQKGLNIASRHITVSTSGLVERIYQFADNPLRVNLAVSLHAPNNELRSRIMRINQAYPIEQLTQAMEYYLQKNNRRITLEYILLKDVNDHREHAVQLAELIQHIRRHINVNLIPYNPVDEHSQYQRSDHETVLAFLDTLKKHSIRCTVRLEHGTDIAAACGQLRSKHIV